MEYNHSIWAPVIIALLFVIYIYSRDKFKREPIKAVLATYFIGICGGLVLLFFYHWLNIPTINDIPSDYEWELIWKFFGGVCLDQLFMLISLYLLLRHNIFADEHTDRMVYAACIAMGVITTRDVAFCLTSNSLPMFTFGVLRGIALIPIFFACGIMLGYYCSSLKIKKIPFFSIKLPLLIFIPIFFQFFLSYIFIVFDIHFGYIGSFIFLFFLIALGLLVYIICTHAIESSQVRDVEEKKVKSMYDTSRYIGKKK